MCEIQIDKNLPEIEKEVLYFGGKEYKLQGFGIDIPLALQNAGAVGGINRKKEILNYSGVPAKFLPYALAHESFCGFIDGTGECVDSVKKELLLVPDNIKDEYILWRIEFFKGMVEFANETKQYKLLIQMNVSLSYLNNLNTLDKIGNKVSEILK